MLVIGFMGVLSQALAAWWWFQVSCHDLSEDKQDFTRELRQLGRLNARAAIAQSIASTSAVVLAYWSIPLSGVRDGSFRGERRFFEGMFMGKLVTPSKKKPAIVKPTSFVLTDNGATIWFTDTEHLRDSQSETHRPLSVGDKRLRLSVLLACATEAAFIVFLTVFLFQHADPLGDGMEMAGVGFAFMLIFLPFTLPAFILVCNGRWLLLAAGLAALAAFAYFGLWLKLLSELRLPNA